MKATISRSHLFRLACLLAVLSLGGCSSEVSDAGDSQAILGSWSSLKTSAPHRDQYVFAEDGTLTVYDDYACSVVADLGLWSLEGSMLTITGVPGIPTVPMPIQWLSNDAFTALVEGGGTLYRSGTEPEGSVLDLPPIPIQDYWTNYEFTTFGGSSTVFRFTAASSDDWIHFAGELDSLRASLYREPGFECSQEEVAILDLDQENLSGFTAGQTYLLVIDNPDQGSTRVTRLSLRDGGV